MLKVMLLLFLMLAAHADEPAFLLKGQLSGRVLQKNFSQEFSARLEPGERSEVRVEIEGVDLQFALNPRWHYAQGSLPAGILLNVAVKCRAEEPKFRFQRNTSLVAQPGQKVTLELNEKEADNLFLVEVEAAAASQ